MAVWPELRALTIVKFCWYPALTASGTVAAIAAHKPVKSARQNTREASLATAEPAYFDVRRAQRLEEGLGRPSARQDAQPRCAGSARHALRRCLHQLPDLRAGARQLCHRPPYPRYRILGQLDCL